MYANSHPVASNQTSVHEKLASRVARHARTQFLKPLTAYNQAAFDTSISAWKIAGSQPLILDSGCGVGLSTLHLASRHPDHFVIGIDQSADRLARKTTWPGAMPTNFILVRANLEDYWRLLHRAGVRPERHYLLYPNPWPKKHHLSRRWHAHPVFPDVVALGGYFECRSNWRIYIEECAAALSQLTGSDLAAEPYLVRQPDTGDAAAITPFEQKYLASGHALWRCRIALTR
jgi:tRNA G46 methylase TrmB